MDLSPISFYYFKLPLKISKYKAQIFQILARLGGV